MDAKGCNSVFRLSPHLVRHHVDFVDVLRPVIGFMTMKGVPNVFQSRHHFAFVFVYVMARYAPPRRIRERGRRGGGGRDIVFG